MFLKCFRWFTQRKRKKSLGTLVKVGIAAVVIGGGWWLLDQGKLIANQFGFRVVSYGTPDIDGTTIDLPINVEFNNPSPAPINLDNVDAKIYLNKNGWTQVASVSQPLNLPSGLNTVTIKAKIDLGKIFGGNFLQTLQAAEAIYAQKFLQVKTDATVTYGGITFPTQTFIQNTNF